MPAASTRIRRIALRTALLLVVATLGLVVTGTLPTLLGYDSFVVTGSSMAPTVRKGSVVIARRVDPHTIAAGDIITFRRTQDPSVAVTHRVIDVREVDGVSVFETKGDANETADPEAVQATELISKMQYSVPYVGYVLMFGRSTMGKAVLIVVPLVALALSFLPARRLRRKDRGVEATAASPGLSEAPARVAPEEPPPARRFPPAPAAAPALTAAPVQMVAPARAAAAPQMAFPARAPVLLPVAFLAPTAVRAPAAVPVSAPPSMALASDRGAATSQRQPDRPHNAAAAARARTLARLSAQVAHREATA